MNLGQRLRRWREIAQLKRRARRDPSPASVCELAERLISYGDTAGSLLVAEAGLRQFPDSERLACVKSFAKRSRHAAQIRRLKDDTTRRATPTGYAQLAELYRELGNDDDALGVAQECVERFPLNEGPSVVIGEIRLERFLGDAIARDAILADEALRRVVRLNGSHARAFTLLAELCWLVGDLRACRRYIRSVLRLTPGDVGLQEFLRTLGGSEPATGEIELAPIAGTIVPERGATFESASLNEDAEVPENERTFAQRARIVEETGVFANPPEKFPASAAPRATRRARPDLDLERLRAAIAALGQTAGIRNLMVLDRGHHVIAECAVGPAAAPQQFSDMVVLVSESAEDAARRLDVGALVRMDIESASGNVMVGRTRDLTVGLLYVSPLRGDHAWDLVQEAFARNANTEIAASATASGGADA